MLLYMTKLPNNCRQRTLEQAQKEAQRAEEGEREAQAAVEDIAVSEGAGEDGGEGRGGTIEEIEERIAIFKIQRARALKVLQALVTDS